MMRKFTLSQFLLVVVLGGLASSCRDDSYYDRPTSLEPPIYEQLAKRSNFTNYLACIDAAGYQKTLSGAGYYTVFAPNDAAFQTFFAEKGISSVEDLSAEAKKMIVAYSLAVVPASKDSIDDYLASPTAKLVKDKAFKKMTYYYKWVYEDSAWVAENGIRVRKKLDLVDMNAVEAEPATSGGFETEDYNRKHIPFFTDNFMSAQDLSASDYNYFFPNSQLSEFNVADAKVVNKNMWAENGIIHEVDRVILPLDNLDEILAETDQCKIFRSILDKYQTSYALASDDYLLKYEQASGGNRKDIYIKDYPYLNYALNCENYLRYGGGALMDATQEGWTLFAPTDVAMNEFFTNKLFKFGYTKLDELPSFVLVEFVNAHLFRKTVWPSKFAVTTNYYGEEARFNAGTTPGDGTDVVKAQMGSNGFFYAVSKIQDTDAFRTVLGDVILNPQYSMMYQALKDNEPLVVLLKNPKSKFRLFLISNDQFTSAGFKYNSASSAWEFTSDASRPDLGTKPAEALQRFLYLHIVLMTDEMEKEGIDFVKNSGVVKTYGEEYIRYINGDVYASGNPTATRPKINKSIESDAINGHSYSLTRPILFSVGNVGNWLSVSSLTAANKATSLMNYLTKAANATYSVDGVAYTLSASAVAYNTSTKAIKDIANTDVITVFLPNDPAMTKAVSEGRLPAISSFAPSGGESMVTTITEHNLLIEKFTKYHIIKGNVPVGETAYGNYTTFYKLEDGSYATLKVEAVKGSPGTITVTDAKGRTAKVLTSATTTYNILGNRCIVHLIDNYLTY
ncbi:MAG: fasciclin domain-containing protein [Breznakibacter sp.]